MKPILRRATWLSRTLSLLLLSITLALSPAASSLVDVVVPPAQAEITVSWGARCMGIMALIASVASAITAGEAHLLYCSLSPTEPQCSAEELAAIEATISDLQVQFDRLWARARALHCVD